MVTDPFEKCQLYWFRWISSIFSNEKRQKKNKKIFTNRINANCECRTHIKIYDLIFCTTIKVSNRLWNTWYPYSSKQHTAWYVKMYIHIWNLYCIDCGPPPATKGRSNSICSIVLVPISVEMKMKFVFGWKSGNTFPSYFIRHWPLRICVEHQKSRLYLNCRRVWNMYKKTSFCTQIWWMNEF